MGRTPQRERLARLLKQGSSIPELREFRSQVRDVHSLGGVMAVDNWIDARREWGLLSGRVVNKAADELQTTIGRVIDEALVKPPPAPPALTWEQRVELINTRETKRRESLPPVGYRPSPHLPTTYERNSLQELQQRDVP